jgi:glucan 1,3-beta-glucosidase
MIGEGGARNTGSVYILDSSFKGTSVAIKSTTPLAGAGAGTTYITHDNVVLQNSATAIQDSTGNTILGGGSTTINSWTLGRVYNSDHSKGFYSSGGQTSPLRPLTSSLRGNTNGGYFTHSKPQYEGYSATSIINVKTYAGAHGKLTDFNVTSVPASKEASC